MRKIKVAISQRIIPHYRVSVFKNLSARENIDLTVFFGKGLATGSQVNSNIIEGFKNIKLFTLKLNYSGIYKSPQLRVWHPFLLFYLIKGDFDVVIVEPSTNFYNNIFSFIYCKIFKKKFIWHDAGSIPPNERPFFRKLIDPLINFFINGADAFITYNSFADKSLNRDFKNINTKIFRAQNTINLKKIRNDVVFYQKKAMDFKNKNDLNKYKLSLYMGGIENRKKINLLIKATNMLNKLGIKCKTIIVGDGPDKNWLINNMTQDDLNNTIFYGKKITDSTKYVLISDVVATTSEMV